MQPIAAPVSVSSLLFLVRQGLPLDSWLVQEVAQGAPEFVAMFLSASQMLIHLGIINTHPSGAWNHHVAIYASLLNKK